MDVKFKKGFFEFISAADSEKVHSQTIGWIFSEYCNVFNPDDKSAILNELCFNKEIIKHDFKTIEKVDVEVKDIDILIEGDDWRIVIENKIKSSQHSNQLLKYEYITSKTIEDAMKIEEQCSAKNIVHDLTPSKRLDGEKQPYYIYLSLIEEEPNGLSNWNPINYFTLHRVIKKRLAKKRTLEHTDWSFVESYLQTINNLSSAADFFIKSPNDFSFVFSEGKKTKTQLLNLRSEENTASWYIKNLQLETILQKWFYSDLVKSISRRGFNFEYNIGETHGTALLDFFFDEITIDNKKYKPILQFQGNAVKLALAGYSDNKNLNHSSLAELRTRRKNRFAIKLAQSPTFFNESRYVLLGDKIVSKIVSDLSTPRTLEGFISIRLDYQKNQDEFWQLKDNPIDFVIGMIKKAKCIYKEIND
jgi:hypothetical protein